MTNSRALITGFTKCHACGDIQISPWLFGRSHFPLVCDECGKREVLRIDWAEMTPEEQEVLLSWIARITIRCLKCGYKYWHRRPGPKRKEEMF
ncbi:hypothetical protein ACFL5H_03050 [Candidatus Latescibacterota bacterium]